MTGNELTAKPLRRSKHIAADMLHRATLRSHAAGTDPTKAGKPPDRPATRLHDLRASAPASSRRGQGRRLVVCTLRRSSGGSNRGDALRASAALDGGGIGVEAGMSRSGFAARFRQLVGDGPIEYLTRWRMLLAGRSLARGEPVGAIARSLGHESESAFSTPFKRVTGRTARHHARLTAVTAGCQPLS